MQKSCLTLILVAPDRMSQPHPLTDDYPINDVLEEMRPCRTVCNESGTLTPNTASQLDDNSRLTSATVSCDPLLLNETIIPIKFIADDSHSSSSPSNSIVLNSKAKYCCTLEVKFIRYVVGIERALFCPQTNHSFHFFSAQIFFHIFSVFYSLANYLNCYVFHISSTHSGMSCHKIFWISKSNYLSVNMVAAELAMLQSPFNVRSATI